MQLGGTMPPGWTWVPGKANDIWVWPSNAYSLTASPGNGSGYGIRHCSSQSLLKA